MIRRLLDSKEVTDVIRLTLKEYGAGGDGSPTSRTPSRAALPVGRPSGGLPNRRLGGLAQTAEETARGLRVGDERHKAHASAAAGATENVDREAALE